MGFKLIFILLIGLLTPLAAQSEIIPSNMNREDRIFLVPYLSQTYSAQYSARPFYLGNNTGFEFGFSTQLRSLNDIKERFNSDDIDSNLTMTHLYINKSLMYGLELGLSSILAGFTSSIISGFGGHIRWYPDIFSNKKFQTVIQAYTEFTNFEDAYFNRDLGLQLGLGYNSKTFSIFIGGDYVFSDASFVAVSNARPITSSGRREEHDIQNLIPFTSIQLHFNNFHINLIQSYNFEATWQSRLNLSYSI